MEKSLMDVVAPLIANRKPTVLRKPCQRALHDPPVSSQFLATLLALSCYAALDMALSEGPFALFVVVGFVGVQLVGALSRSAARALDRFDRVHKFLKDRRIMDVCSGEHHTERDALSVNHNMALRARLSLIRRIRAACRSPLLAGTLAESKEALSQSIWSASPRRSSKLWCTLSHTPASCHSHKRRQQVTPEPQPISCGSISQGMPLFSTKMMPVSAARFGIGGRPPFGLGRSGGNSGSISIHNSSGTRGLAMPARTAPSYRRSRF